MCEETRTDGLIPAVRELDTAKALLRQIQRELNAALPARPQNGDSEIFQAACRKMNEASERYRRAVEAFNVVCHNHTLQESDRPHAQPVDR